MGNHNTTVVGKGKHVAWLVKRPTAEQIRNNLRSKLGARQTATPVARIASPQAARIAPSPQPMSVRAIEDIHDQANKFARSINNQHTLWTRDVNQYQMAIAMAKERYGVIIDSQAEHPLFAAILESLLTTLTFAVIPALGPVKAVAEKLRMGTKAEEKLLEVVKEFGKVTLEKGSSTSEGNVAIGQKAMFADFAVQFFQNMEIGLSDLINNVSNAVVSMTHYMDGLKPEELAVQLPVLKSKWENAGFRRGEEDEDLARTNLHAHNLGLVFLYAMLKAFCKTNVSLKANLTALQVAGPGPADNADFTEKARYLAKVALTDKKYNATISKEDFNRFRREDPNFDVEFENLDRARRAKMYEYFRDIDFVVQGFPPITDWLSLIKHWEFSKE